jgi:ribosomal-protein-alanine N-acetyltransferase
LERGNARVMLDIVAMTLNDLPAVLEIERSSHLEPWSQAFFVEELERTQAHTYVACVTNPGQLRRVVGYVCFWVVADEVQIFNIAVHLAHRRQGVGQALLLHALGVGCRHQARVAVLEVRRSNDAARRLYSSLGFRPVGERKDYYGGLRESAVLMELEMSRDWCDRSGMSEDCAREGGASGVLTGS